jgi:hypothetical protein
MEKRKKNRFVFQLVAATTTIAQEHAMEARLWPLLRQATPSISTSHFRHKERRAPKLGSMWGNDEIVNIAEASPELRMER